MGGINAFVVLLPEIILSGGSIKKLDRKIPSIEPFLVRISML